jgi:hypothetical protein
MKAGAWPLAAAALLSCALAAEPSASGRKATFQASRIPILIRQLGDDQWRTRESASRRLRKVGAPALPALKIALRSKDLEVRTRAEHLLQVISRDVAFSRMGNTLIADTYGGRVVEVDKKGEEIWALDDLREPVVAQRLADGKTVIAEREGGGKVAICDRAGKRLWEMSGLGTVWCANRLPGGNVLITSCGSDLFSKGRVIEVNRDRKIVWEKKNLDAPRSCQRLPNGNTLIVERKAERVIEVDKAGKTVWKVEELNAPLSATRLPGGNTLISEWKPGRVVEVDRRGKIVWKFSAGLSGTSSAQRLANGHTLITDFGSNRVLQVDSAGKVIWEHARLNSPCCAVRLEKSGKPSLSAAPSKPAASAAAIASRAAVR